MSEEVYDKEIGPELMRLGELCQKQEMSFLAMVEYAPNDSAETTTIPTGAGPKSRLVYYAIKAHGNIDNLILMLLEDCKQHGNQSLFIQMIQRHLNT